MMNGVDLGRVGRMDKSDQNILYKILKELIKIIYVQSKEVYCHVS